jgi:hypothetical protein
MHDELWLAAALISTLAGMGWLALAMDVHWDQVSAGASRPRRTAITLRMLGFAALGASLGMCLRADTATMAMLVWMMMLAMSAAIITFVLSARPRALAVLTSFRGTAPRD